MKLDLGNGTTVTMDASRTMVLDIETGGFSGTPAFLIGVLLLDPDGARIVQWLARDYPEESAVVRCFMNLAADYPIWISFNGKSFDAPFLRDRATLHRSRPVEPDEHIDLLHVARRRWRDELPDCRLTTIEREVLGRTRLDDVPGRDVPDLFHHFIRTGNATPLRPVLEHNRRDLITTIELLGRLVS